jgi:hypothetical protein
MKVKAKCLHVQKYLGNICVDSGLKTTDEKRSVPRVVEGRMMDVLEPVHPAGPGHPIHVNKEQTMFRVNFTFQQLPLVGDLTLVGVIEDKYVEGEEYELEFTLE